MSSAPCDFSIAETPGANSLWGDLPKADRCHTLRIGMTVTLFLCGDLMTGRGVDQILSHPSRPEIDEQQMKDACGYVQLAERVNGPIPRGVVPNYIWGDALEELDRVQPDARIVNLETSITVNEERYPKEINYRMHPANVECLTAARLDVCVLANNHVLDYGTNGLLETLGTLACSRIAYAGAGRTLAHAQQPAIIPTARGRVLVFAFGTESSGVPRKWAASVSRPGVDWIADLSDETAQRIGQRVGMVKRAGDIVIASIHWGSNWGYQFSDAQGRFARRLIDVGVDLVHGHSSHHPRPIEVYRGKLILYGCGDFLNDYEGIPGYEEFRGELVLMYFPTIDPATGRLVELWMTPMQIRKMQLRRARVADTEWLRQLLDRISAPLGSRVVLDDARLRLIKPAAVDN
jgi:poly-gamma-glutamate capsule biosynthesis protein CapA/YwtB (metallophosphatase superfamily)